MATILFVGKGPPDRGGIAAFISTLLASDLIDQHDIRFLNLAHDQAREGGRVTVRNIQRTIRDLVAVWRASDGCDVVHVHSALNPLVTLLRATAFALAARTRGAEPVIHAHGGKIQLWLTTPARRFVCRLALKTPARVLAVSRDVETILADVLEPERVVLVENGVDTRVFRPSFARHNPPRVLYVGLLTERKGVLDLLSASELVRRRDIPHELWLVGGTPDEGGRAEAEVRALASGRARLLGSRPHDEMAAIYRSVDVFCLPSWWEGMPLSLLEAMASGLPTVASRVGEVPRMIEDGVTGLLVPPRDPDALADALGRMLTRPQQRTALGHAAYERVHEKFSLTRTVETLDTLYRELAPGTT